MAIPLNSSSYATRISVRCVAANDVRSGEPNTPPATVPVAVYPVMLEGDDVLVDVHGTLDQRVSAQSASKEN